MNPERTAKDWIAKLGLKSHPEGGFYAETYRADETINWSALPMRFSGNRAFSTAIYFLLEQNDFSAFHKIQSDELWHHYAGGNLRILTLEADGNRRDLLLGTEGEAMPQQVVKAGTWFASVPEPGVEYVLSGCTVAPAFDFADFQMANREKLLSTFPGHGDIIKKYCR